jgi:LuxR family transcriptional regulator, maltose regulon positive regulatory protein
MSRPPTHALVWMPENASYELWTQGRREFFFQAGDEALWLAWLETHQAFSFRGQKGHLNVLKENRQRGRGYWYGYRGLKKHTIKRYLGPTTRVTLARLEEVADEFEQTQALTDAHLLAAEDGAGISRPASGPAWSEHASLIQPLSLKFRPPRLREHLVERPNLVQLLEEGPASGLTLLSAPAGFGKTTLVSQWLASLQKEEPVVAWVSLDEHDNDVVRFWRCVVGACQGMLGERTKTVLEHLAVLARSPSLLESPVLELVLTTFLNELASIPGHGMIVLEDYHFITLPQIHTSLTCWIEHLPSSQHVIMLTRHDPPLPLAQWRVRGILHEIRSGMLRFTADETALFFQRYSTYAISHADMIRLLKHTEGWIAGLQLAVLALNAQSTEETVSSVLQGNHRYIADYLVQEVLNHLPENVQLFLLQTSLLERLQSRLCEAVTGQSEGQHMLAWLEQANLFLVPLDETRQWYRYHHLFREMLFQLLVQKAPEDVAELHRRAGRWFLHEQMPAEAISHAHTAGDFVTLAESIEQSQSALLQQGESATLFSWVHLLPQAVLFERLAIFFLACMENMATHRTQVAAELLNTYARLHHLPETGTHDIDELERALCEHVSQLFPLQQDDQQRDALYGFLGFYATLALVMESNVALYQQIRQRSERYASAPRQRLQESWLAALLQGDIQGAIADLMKHLTELTTQHDNAILFVYLYPTLTFLLATTGQLQLIESIAQRVLQRQDTLDARLNHGPALINLGSLAYERDQLKQAEASIQAGLPLCNYPGSEAAHYRGLLILAKIKRAQEDRTSAWTILQELEKELLRSGLEANALKTWRGLLAWEALALGDTGYAQFWLRDNPVAQDLATRLNPLFAHIYLTQAFFLLRFERRAEAETLLSDLNGWTRQLELHGILIPLLALQSILAQAKGESTQAETMLKEALVLAESSGYVRTFLDLGEEMQALLLRLWNQRSTGGQYSSARYLGWLLVSARNARDKGTRGSPMKPIFSQSLIEPLSQREQEVLHEINEGYSNQEIARRLMISSSTVKSHINSIYRKFQTKSRTQTVARARTLNLFPR